MARRNIDYADLSIEERLQLIEEIWATILHDAPGDPELTSDQAAEIERRAQELRVHPERGVPWDVVRAGIVKDLERGA